jgi:hypothetical protein
MGVQLTQRLVVPGRIEPFPGVGPPFRAMLKGNTSGKIVFTR